MHAHGLHACIDVESNILAWCARAQIAHLLPKRTSLGVRDRHVVSFRQDNLRVMRHAYSRQLAEATGPSGSLPRYVRHHDARRYNMRARAESERNERLRRQAPCTAVSVRSDPARLSRAPARARSQALRPNPKPAESGRRCGSGESSPGADVAGVSPVPCACRRGSEGARPTDTYVSERMHTLKTT